LKAAVWKLKGIRRGNNKESFSVSEVLRVPNYVPEFPGNTHVENGMFV
jgi:hypothetical protein